jgi:hypothetical protein
MHQAWTANAANLAGARNDLVSRMTEHLGDILAVVVLGSRPSG